MAESDRATVERFLQTPWWESTETEATLLARDCTIEWPFAPPGVPKHFPRTKRPLLADWFKRTTQNWSRDSIIIYPTKNGRRYWVESRVQAQARWGPHSPFRPYSCSQMELIELDDGKISLVRSWMDPMAFYLGAGINLPVFPYDGTYPQGEAMLAVPSPPAPKGDEEAAKKANFVVEEFEDDDVVIVESNGSYGVVKWDPTGATSGYWNDYVRIGPSQTVITSLITLQVIFVSLKDFQLKQFREYLDPINKLLAAGVQVPTFPFFY
ncbi:hypothetical protein LTR85_008263 [Meristemomyces frigidus]|nr:hypothetical protein LTR85_008263 [Meristemomyces frigidus]